MHAVIMANGLFSDYEKKQFQLLKQHIDYYAVDGGHKHLDLMGIKDYCHLGDFDSSTDPISSRVHLPDQNYSDLEKALDYITSLKKYKSISVFAIDGKRFDHALHNFSILYSYYFLESVSEGITIHTNHGQAFWLNSSQDFKLNAPIGSCISLFRFNNCHFKHSKGLKYSLDDLTFSFPESRQSLSNVTTSSEVSISLKEGIALILLNLSS